MVRTLFIDHPASVGESYVEHLFASLGTAAKLAAAAGACVVHAVVPALCKNTGSTAIMRLHAGVLAQRGYDQPML